MTGHRPFRATAIAVAAVVAGLGFASVAPAHGWDRMPARADAGGGAWRQGPRAEDRRGIGSGYERRCGRPGGGAIIGAIAGGLLGSGAPGYGDRGPGPIEGRGADRDC